MKRALKAIRIVAGFAVLAFAVTFLFVVGSLWWSENVSGVNPFQ